jgi:PAS domain S-box-containing protein
MNTKSSEAGRPERYDIAFLAVVVAFAASYVTWPYSRTMPWVFFFAAVMVSAWFGGQRPSLLATALLVVIGRYLFIRPFGTFSLTYDSIIQILVFTSVSLFIGFLSSAIRRAEGHERALRRRFQATVMSIGDAVIATDAAGQVAFMNGVAEGLTGWSFDEAQGKPLDQVFVVISENNRTPAPTLVNKVLESGRTQSLGDNMILIARDGGERPIDDSAAPIKNDQGETTGVVLVFHDITDRMESEKETRRLTARLASQARVFDTALSNAADFIYTFDLHGRFTYINHALLDLLRKDADEAIGKNFFELEYPPALAERLQRQIQQAINSKDRVSDETPLTSAIGTRFYEYIFVPVIGPDGEVEAVAGSTRDVTERKEVEDATRRRAGQLQRLAEIATRINGAHDVKSVIGVVTEEVRSLIGARESATSTILTPHQAHPLNFVSTAQCRSYERTSHEIDGGELYKALEAATQPVCLTQSDLANDPRWRKLEKVALALPTSNGWLGVPLVGRAGTSIGLIQLADKNDGEFTADDVAIAVQLSRLAAIAIENAMLYDDLRQNDQRKDEFLAMLAHELRNPLAAIGNAVNVTKQTGLKEHVDWSIDVITRQMNHLTRLIDDLLDVSRINRGKIELRKVIVDATPILDSAIATVRPLADERKHTIDVSIERGALWVNVDPTRLEQVVVNLLNNAAKYSENGGHIVLSATLDGGVVTIVVRDRGVGIPPERLPGMFELFAQGDRSLARSEGGLGIGLTVVKKLVEMHGGSVVAKSKGVGQGSEFTIRLPVATRPSVPSANLPAQADRTDNKARILVVDDNVDTAQGMVRLLSLIGHETAIAHDGNQALQVAREFRPEFVLLDIGLPGMDGYQVAARMRQEECCKNSVIVAVSGYGRDEDRKRSTEFGFDHHFSKPLDHDALLSLIATAGNVEP